MHLPCTSLVLISRLISSTASSPLVPSMIQTLWFIVDADREADLIPPDGFQTLCQDLQIDLETPDPIVMSYKLFNASDLCYITHLEWSKALTTNQYMPLLHTANFVRIDSLDTLKNRLAEFTTLDPDHLGDFYKSLFNIAKPNNLKSLDLETAIPILSLLPQIRPVPHLESFIAFLTVKQPVKALNRDQWNCFWEFSKSMDPSFVGYNIETSAWPTLFDEFVDWLKQ
ncbi:DCN1-like protein 4 [Neolecta irregularis DAH-3]|uniref:Defective in cullin neddylation protein n=1 Tax=Neolecta irregularis (strain DAH-3) TaxID=1198029 RepID=A0A1U7LU17_NEOID|nr:DCN1-like protein 4 [Neolecta irregularis DAH-3]|eukprot:OLL26073.1 DCN1-like protein 4 [Neolecta irregularis DAH-3]